METPTNTVHSKPVRRLGLSRRFRGTPLLTPPTCSTPNSNQKDDPQKRKEKTDTSSTSAISTKVIDAQKQNDTPSSQSNNSGNSNPSISSLETPTSSRINQKKFKLSLGKTATESNSRKRMQYLRSESLIQPKRLKLDESQLSNKSISENENRISSCDSGNVVIATDAAPDDENTLTKEISELKSTIASIRKYEERSSELLRLIPKWREAGEKTIEELKLKIQPKQNAKVILHHFNIDPTLFNVDEEE